MKSRPAKKKNNDSNDKDRQEKTLRPQPPGRATRIQTRKEPFDPRKKPRQKRSREMVDAILEAAAELFASEGYARTTTNKIARRAGVSVGSLYQYFPNKDSVLGALWAQHREAVHPIIEEALKRLSSPKIPLEDGFRSLLTELLDAHRSSPAVTRALSTGVIRESPMATEHEKDEEGDQLLETICEILLHRPDVRKGDHLAMAAVLTHFTSQLTRWLAHDPPTGISPEALLEESVQLLSRFLSK